MSVIKVAIHMPEEYDRASMRELIDRMVLAINQTTTGAPEGRESRAAVPTGGTWKRGHILYNSAPSAAGTVGWICTASGTPGTWKTFGTIAA